MIRINGKSGRSKYRAVRTTVDGIEFASRKEAARYQTLKTMERGGLITEFELQPAFPIVVNGVKVCKYVADFQYRKNGESVTEDVKGFKTPVYKIKAKLVKAIFGVTIREV